MPLRTYQLVFAFSIFALSALSGCAMFDQSPLTAFDDSKADFATPHQLISVWSDTVLHQVNRRGTRGCGGRVMFYGPDGKRSVRVEGSVIVYAWDDSRRDLRRQPDRKFVFRAEELQNHYSPSKIGHSYSFWIPWDAAGGPRQQLTLLTRFVSNDGAEVTSTPAKVILPGDVPMPEESQKQDQFAAKKTRRNKSQSEVRQASFERSEPNQSDETDDLFSSNEMRPRAARSEESASEPALRSHEINLTSGFLRRNLNGNGLTSEELFGDLALSRQQPAMSRTSRIREDETTRRALFSVTDGAENSEATASHDDRVSTTARSTKSKSKTSSDKKNVRTIDGAAPAQITLQPPGRSLRFQDRVKQSRAAQRERFQ